MSPREVPDVPWHKDPVFWILAAATLALLILSVYLLAETGFFRALLSASTG